MKIISPLLASLALLAWTEPARATVNLWVSDDDGGLSTDPVLGSSGIAVYCSSDPFWTVVISSGVAYPPAVGQGTLSAPVMDLAVHATSVSTTGERLHPLVLTFAADGFGPSSLPADAKLSGYFLGDTIQPVTFNTFYSAANELVPNPSATALTSSGTLLDPSYNGEWTGGAGSLDSPYSLSEVVTIQGSYTDGGSYSLDASIVIPVPEPTTLVAGALLLLPVGTSVLRTLRKSRNT